MKQPKTKKKNCNLLKCGKCKIKKKCSFINLIKTINNE